MNAVDYEFVIYIFYIYVDRRHALNPTGLARHSPPVGLVGLATIVQPSDTQPKQPGLVCCCLQVDCMVNWPSLASILESGGISGL